MKVQKNTVPLSKKFANSFLLLTRVFTIELSYRYITIPISEFSRQPCSYNSFTSKFIQYINFAIPRRSDKIFDVVNICIFLKFLSRIIGTMKESSSSKFLGGKKSQFVIKHNCHLHNIYWPLKNSSLCIDIWSVRKFEKDSNILTGYFN